MFQGTTMEYELRQRSKYTSRQLNLHFVLKPQECKLNGEILCDEPYLFEIKPGIFFRSYTGNETSMIKMPEKQDIRTILPTNELMNYDNTLKKSQKDRLSSAYL